MMWFLFKSMFAMVIVAAAAYTLIFVDFSGKSLLVHGSDVWGSEVVQDKVELVKDGVKREIEARLDHVAGEVAKDAAGSKGMAARAGSGEFDAKDKQSLNELIAKQ